MLGWGRYLQGVLELLWLVGFAWVGAARLRRRWLPEVGGEAGFLATVVIAAALLIWVGEALGTFSAFKAVPYLIGVAVVGAALRFFVSAPPASDVAPAASSDSATDTPAEDPAGPDRSRSRPSLIATVISLLIAGIAIGHFVSGVKLRLGTGMTGFDSTWYHGPFAAGFFQSGNTIDLHYIAPQFLAWFYPANSEVVGAIGMLAFHRDLLSPLLNLGWLLGCLLACWCIGRPFRVAPWSLALGAIALSVPALADQAGEARNDMPAIFFLLAAIAIALNAAASSGGKATSREGAAAAGPERQGLTTGALLLVGLSIGLAAGTKLNYLLPAAVLVLGLTALAPSGRRWVTLLASGGMALAGSGYWLLRNLVQAGNPLPWIHHLGPITLPAPEQALGGRESHSVLSYLTNGNVWSEWFLPGLHGGLWIIWPLLVAAALAGLVLALVPLLRTFRDRAPSAPGRRAENRTGSQVFGPSTAATAGVLALAGMVGLAAALSWLVSPTSASGPLGEPRGFESGLRYGTAALILGLALLPAVPPLRDLAARLASLGPRLGEVSAPAGSPAPAARPAPAEDRIPRDWIAAFLVLIVLLGTLAGYPVQRHYLKNRYRDPSFTAPGLDAAFAWARNISGSRIATTSTRQYPLFGTELSNHVAYIGVKRPHGGYEEAPNCRVFRRFIDAGDYEYVVATRDRIEAGKPAYPPQVKWTEGPNAEVVLKKKPTVVFRIAGPLDPSACP